MRKHWHLLLLIAALALGGWLRFRQLGLMEFKLDEALLHQAALMQAAGDFQLHGIVSSVGLRNPPMSVYILSIPALLSKSPLVMAGFVALLNTAAIALTYFLARQWLSKGTSLIAAWLFAASPWAVMFSRKIWAQDLLPFFTTIFFICIIRWIRTARWGWMIGTATSFAVLCQIHYSALALFPIIPCVLIWKRSRLTAMQAAAGAVIFIMLWMPFMVVIARGEAMAAGKYQRPARNLSDYPKRAGQALLWQGLMIGHGGLRDITFGPDAEESRLPNIVYGCAVVAGLIAVVWFMSAQKEMLIMLGWLLLPPLALSLHKIHFHYMVICFPALFIALGLLVELLHECLRGKRTLRLAFAMLVAALALVIVLNESVFTLRLHDDLAKNGGGRGDYGVTYQLKVRIAQMLIREGRNGHYSLVDYTNPTPSEKSYEYLYKLIGGQGQRARPGAPGIPVYVLLGPDVEGRMQSDVLMMADMDRHVGPIRVQKFILRRPKQDLSK